jgi:ABC-type branched-subunit amino acid transport system ATPase component
MTGARAGSTLLEIDSLSVRFGGVAAVDDLHLSVREGSVHGIIGPNGAGKTTLLNCVSGLCAPVSGRVMLAGDDITRVSAWRRVNRGIGRTFQNPALINGLSVVDNVEVGMFAQGRSSPIEDAVHAPRARRHSKLARQRALEALAEFELLEHANDDVDSLPLGTRKRVDLARARVMSPRLLMLDEPTSGLGDEEIAEVQAVIHRIKRTCTIMIIAHHLDFVMDVADVITVLNFGREVTTGPPLQVRWHPAVIEAYIGNDLE